MHDHRTTDKFILFFHKKSALELQQDKKINKFKISIYKDFAIYYLSMVIIISIPMSFIVQGVARRVTVQIIRLHDIVKTNLTQDKEHMILSYLPQNKELSTLHLEFNKAARTLKITSESEASSNYK